MRCPAFGLILLVSAAASAQTTNATFQGGDFAIDWTSPTSSQGRLDCTGVTETCRPINAAACDDGDGKARQVELTVTNNVGNIALIGARLFVWLQRTSGTQTTDEATTPFRCEYTAQSTSTSEGKIGDPITLNITSPLVSTTALEFPDVFTSVTLTVGDLLHGAGEAEFGPDACEDATEFDYYLCFGVDADISGATDYGKVNQQEPQAWVRIRVDTNPPPAPSVVRVDGLDGRLSVKPDVTEDTASGDEWVARIRPAADAAAPNGAGCEAWTGTYAEERAMVAAANIDFAATNGVMYEGCVFLEDAVGNRGDSLSFAASPMDQCDFVECYPGDLQVGYCGAGLDPHWLLWLVGLAALRRTKRSRR